MSIRDEIELGNQRFCHALGAHDMAALLACYDEQARVLIPGVPIIVGAAAVAAYYAGVFAAGVRGATMRIEHLEERTDCVVEAGCYTMDLQPEGAALMRDEGKYQIVYRRDAAGNLRIWYDMFHSDSAARR